MDARQIELALEVTELEQGAVIDLWLGDDLLSVHWGIDAEAAANCASVAVAEYLATGLPQTD